MHYTFTFQDAPFFSLFELWGPEYYFILFQGIISGLWENSSVEGKKRCEDSEEEIAPKTHAEQHTLQIHDSLEIKLAYYSHIWDTFEQKCDQCIA